MNEEQLRALTASGESVAREFKCEMRSPLNDAEVVEAVTCLANSSVSGVVHRLLIGVEDDGVVSGRSHEGATGNRRCWMASSALD